MSTLASLIVDFEARTAEWTKGVASAEKSIAHVGESFEGITSIIEGVGAAIGVAFGAEEFKSMVEHTMEQVTASYRLSDALGMTTAQLQGLQSAGRSVGLTNDQITTGLQRFAKSLGTAAAEGGTAADTLKALGLDTSKLVNQGLDESFKQVAGSIASIHNPVERARVLTELFGKEGMQLAPLFEKGAAGIDEAVRKAQKMGVALSDVDAAKVVAADEAFDEVGQQIQGVENQLVVALAPALTSIAQHVLAVIPPADKMRSMFLTGIEWIVKGVGFAVDIFRGFKLVVLGIATAGSQVFTLLMQDIEDLASAVTWLLNKIFKTDAKPPKWLTDFTDRSQAFTDSLAQQTNDVIDSIGDHSKIDAFFADIRKQSDDTAKAMASHRNTIAHAWPDAMSEAAKKVGDILKQMQDEVDQFGMDATEKKLQQLQSLNTNHQFDKQIAEAQKLVDQYRQMDQYKKDIDEGHKLMTEFESPQEKYQEQISKLDQLLQAGAIGEQTYVQAKIKSLEDLAKATGMDQQHTAENKERIYNFRLNTASNDPMDKLRQLQQKNNDTAEQSKFFLSQMYLMWQQSVGFDSLGSGSDSVVSIP